MAEGGIFGSNILEISSRKIVDEIFSFCNSLERRKCVLSLCVYVICASIFGAVVTRSQRQNRQIKGDDGPYLDFISIFRIESC